MEFQKFLVSLADATEDLADLIAANYEGSDAVAALPSINNISEAVELLQSEGFTPPPLAVQLIAHGKRQIN
jgi:hypothetical protein